MVTDTIETKKPLQNPETIATSLIALRDELLNRTLSGFEAEILFKVNSCLYSRYPEYKS